MRRCLSLGKAPAQAICSLKSGAARRHHRCRRYVAFVVDEETQLSCRDAARYLTHSLQPARQTCEGVATARISNVRSRREDAGDRSGPLTGPEAWSRQLADELFH